MGELEKILLTHLIKVAEEQYEKERQEYKEHVEKYGIWRLTEQSYKKLEFNTNKNQNANLHKEDYNVLIDLALITNDKEWFNELTKRIFA